MDSGESVQQMIADGVNLIYRSWSWKVLVGLIGKSIKKLKVTANAYTPFNRKNPREPMFLCGFFLYL
jgi:hypothetical protein